LRPYSTHFNVSIYEKKKSIFLKILDREGFLKYSYQEMNKYTIFYISDQNVTE